MEINNLITEEIKRYKELMGQPLETINEAIIPINSAAKGLGRFARGAARNALDNIVTKEIKTAVNKTFKNTTSAFFSDIVSGIKRIDTDLLAKAKPQEVSNNIIKSLRKQGYVLTNLEEMALRKEVTVSLKKTLANPSQKLRMYKRSFNRPQLDEFNRLKAGRNLSDDQLLKLARKASKFKSKPVVPKVVDDVVDNTGGNMFQRGVGNLKKFGNKVSEAWQRIKIRWNSLSRAQRRFWRVTGLVLGVSLLAWLYFVLSKEGFCKCLLNMMKDSDADYMDSVSMEDAMFLGTTGNSELDGQGGGIFYLDGKFKTKNGRIQGSYTCNDQGVFITAGGKSYELQCVNGVEDLLPLPVDPDDETNTQTGSTIVFKDCLGPEYKLGCTDKGDLIERVQACLKLPVTGKFDKDLEVALIKKIGKNTFTEEDVFIICGTKQMTQFTRG